MLTTKKKSGLTVEQAKQILQTDIDRRKRNIKLLLVFAAFLVGYAIVRIVIILNS
mgnify:CR=1 FL=1